ncbi:hypothetical protein ACFPTO_06605 [Paraburkholderia denitrificans]|uniref:Uncharacterized protein n=1 Tax=Paraburkholderia denitrificans TaxID=694025 RepID=A0ABW0J650_9BURK
MSALHLHLETVIDEPDFMVLRTTTEPGIYPVVMVVRADELRDAVLTMLDALPAEDEQACTKCNYCGK